MKTKKVVATFQNLRLQKGLPKQSELKKATQAENFVVIYDEKLRSLPNVREWRSTFAHSYAVTAGESLKSIDHFADHIRKLLPAFSGHSPRKSAVVALGGGSVGDFAGFVASVMKRGVGYVNIPTTWLAALDSAHGAKNGLNVGAFKNQVGTFYEAQKVYCVKEILLTQPQENIHSAFGEVMKMSMLDRRGLFQKLTKIQNFDAAALWDLLPHVIQSKFEVVSRDPFEKTGERHVLNLGHTLGHVFELEQLLPHGVAVQRGLEFALEWGRMLNVVSDRHYQQMRDVLMKNRTTAISPISRGRMQKILQQDKKMVSHDRLRFVFVRKPGEVVIQEKAISDIVNAAYSLGWAK
jgi:3-dehydroquinate synthase